MKRNTRRRWIGMLSLGLIAVAAIVVVLAVFAGTNDDRFTATGYSDVIRFQAEGVATLQVRIFDLSGREVWDSGMVSGWTVDWDRRNDTGERLAYGAYIYSAQGWNAQGDLIFQKNGKLALMPGDQVQLQAAPVELPLPSDTVAPYSASDGKLLAPMGHTPGISTFDQVGIGTTSPSTTLHVLGRYFSPSGKIGLGIFSPVYYFEVSQNAPAAPVLGFRFTNNDNTGYVVSAQKCGAGQLSMGMYGTSHASLAGMGFMTTEATSSKLRIGTEGSGDNLEFIAGGWSSIRMTVNGSTGNVGIGTSNTTARLTVQDSSGQDLIAAYNSSNRVFVVKNNGEVRADGAYYGASFNTGSADVAERINTSEWVEAGEVVEIDPNHPGFFRKASSPYSTRVAGIISTSPGVILGNSFDEATDDWEDNRPVLAVTGRVPCKVSNENGPIEIGDLLVASSMPGIAMKGNPEEAIGAVVGKAMEPLENGEGTIVVQVMLR